MHKWHIGTKNAASGAHKGLMEEIKEWLKKFFKSVKKIPTNEEKMENKYEKTVHKSEIQMVFKTHEKMLLSEKKEIKF